MIITNPVVDMRQKPSLEAEVVSQVLFSEKVEVLMQNEDWVKISSPDGYFGWIEASSLLPSSYDPSIYTCSISVPVYAQKDIRFGPTLLLPFGVGLEGVDSSDLNWIEVILPSKEHRFIQKGNLSQEKILSKWQLAEFAFKFLGLPYIWGGRSSFGYDCSGFVQMLYKQMGIILPRDAALQIKDPQFCEIAHPSSGDLIFWGISCEKIQHVGLYIGEGKFIHASNREQMPWLRISCLKDSQWDPKTSSIYPYRCYTEMKLGFD